MAIGAAIFQSGGQRTEHYIPGAYSRSVAVGGASGGVSANNGVIMARSKGGQPQTLFTFSSTEEARETLVDGDLLKAVAHAFVPSKEYTPQYVKAMVVNGNTQGSTVLRSGGFEVLRLKTASWGVIANSVARQIVNGETPGTKKVVFTAGDVKEAIDNIGKRSIKLRYHGDGMAVLDVNNIGLSIEVTGSTSAGTQPGVDIDGLAKLKVGEARDFTVTTKNPEMAAISVVAKFNITGVDNSLLKVEFFETAGGVNEWETVNLSALFKGPEGWNLGNNTFQFRITPLAGAEGAIIDYRLTLYEVIDDVPTNHVIAQTTTGKTEIVAESAAYSVLNIPCYDANSGSLYVPFEDYQTIEEVVERINGTEDFVALQLEEDANVPSRELDFVDSFNLLDEVTLTSNFYAFVQALENSPWIGKGNVEKVEGAPNLVPGNDAEPVYFEGASAGTYTINDWNKTLAALEAEEIQIMSSPVTDHAVHNLISNHTLLMSSTENRKERTAFLGGPIGETIEDAIEFAKSLNNKLVSYCYPAITANSPLTGQPENLPASYFACKLLGMESAVAINEPLTWKDVDVLKFAKKLKNTELNKLIIAGVLAGGTTSDNRLAVIRAMTTHQGNQLQLVERSMVREDLYMNRDIRIQLGAGTGKPALDKGGNAEKTLIDAARGWKGEGLIVPTDDGENIWDVSVKKDGDKTYLSFRRNLTPPENFFFVTAHNYVYSNMATYEI